MVWLSIYLFCRIPLGQFTPEYNDQFFYVTKQPVGDACLY